MRSTQSRVSDLERRSGGDDIPESLIVAFVRSGPDGPIHYDPSGYSTSFDDDRAMRWHPQPEETMAQLRERVTLEVPRHSRSAAMLFEI